VWSVRKKVRKRSCESSNFFRRLAGQSTSFFSSVAATNVRMVTSSVVYCATSCISAILVVGQCLSVCPSVRHFGVLYPNEEHAAGINRHQFFLLRNHCVKCDTCRSVFVLLSVCPSRWCIVSKRLKISSNFILRPVAPSF